MFLFAAITASTAAFQFNVWPSNQLRSSERTCLSTGHHTIRMAAAKGFGSSVSADKKNQKAADGLAKASNPTFPPIPIVPHELPPGSQFMGM